MKSPFTFSFATSSDVQEMFEFLLSDFLFNTSLNGAIGMTREDAYDRYLAVTKHSVAEGTSVVVRNEEGAVIGVRLSGFEDRHEVYPPVDLSKFAPRILKIRKILTVINEGKWDLIPADIDRLFDVKLISVAEKYRGRGIAKILLTYGLDAVKDQGAKGAFAEAVAIASQMLFDKAGYSVIREIVHEEWLDDEGKPVFVCPDGTKTVQLVFKRL